MSFLDVIPFTLFRMLSSPAHARNVAVLERIFEQFFDDFAFAPKKAEVLQVIQEVLDNPDYRTLPEDEVSGPLTETAEHVVYSRLREDGWIIEVANRRTIEVYMPREARALLSSLIRPPSAVKNIECAFNVVLPELGDLEVGSLTYSRLTKWRNDLATHAKRVRKKRNATKQPTRPIPDTDDARRARRATANRVLTQLKAALNRAFRAGRIATDEAWRKVTPFKRVDAAVVRYLSTDETRRLVNACPSDFRRLVQGAILTGCRYSELTRVCCRDFNADADTLAIRQSKGGKVRHVFLTQDARKLFLTWTAGRPTTAQIFLRDDGERWGKSHQLRPIADASEAAHISPPATFNVLRHTHASHLAMTATPMGVIAAQLGHVDTRMAEKHYAHLAPSYIADTIRANLPALGVVGEADSLEADQWRTPQ